MPGHDTAIEYKPLQRRFITKGASRFSAPIHWIVTLLSILCAPLPAWAKEPTGKQVLVETYMLRLDTDKLPANIKQTLSQPGTRLTDEQREQVLKAASNTGGEVLASPTLLMLDGTEAELKAVELRRYVAAFEPELDSQGQPLCQPSVQDAETGMMLKVKADVSDDGKHVRLRLAPRLAKLLELVSYTFDTQGKKDRVSIQQPRNQETSVNTVVIIPDGQTLVLGGQTLGDKPKSQTLLILVRPTILPANAQPTTRPANPAAITIQTKLLSVSRNFIHDIGDPFPASGKPPFLDDAQAQRLFGVMQATAAVVTAPRATFANGQEVILQATTSTSYLGSFTIAKDAAGKPKYEPKIESKDDGLILHFTASAVPGRDAVSVSADVAAKRLLGLQPFTFLDKPEKLTVQQPTYQVLSANLNAAIPDRHWLVVGPLSVEGTVERETGVPVISQIPGLKRLFTNRTTERDTSDIYLLIRPEMLDLMPTTAPGLQSLILR